MSELDLLKEKIALLKLWLGIFVVTEISLLGWLAANFSEATMWMRVSSIVAIVGLLGVILAFNRRIEALIERLRDL